MPLATPLAAEIRSRAAAHSMTLHSLAAASDISDASLSHRLTGRTPWGLGEIDRIARALGTSASDLLAAAERADELAAS